MSLRVLSPGALTTVQDRGREGWRHLGVARAGALDPQAAALANRLVGNEDDAAVLEFTLHGPALQLERPARIALCGARVSAHFQRSSGARTAIPGGRPIELPAGTLQLAGIRDGVRAWLAIDGGIDVPLVLGSRSTDLRGGFGGFEGRALQRGDVLALGAGAGVEPTRPHIPDWWVDPYFGEFTSNTPIHYVPSTHPAARAMAARSWQASPRSNRQGLRLEGEAIAIDAENLISEPVAPGTIQLPPDGRPIVLMADAQTVGGYPRLGHVIAADMPRLAQAQPNASLRFAPCDVRTATRLACAARARLARIGLMIDARLALST